MTWNDESEIVTAERIEQSRNPHHATTTAARAESDYDPGDESPRCPTAARQGRWHRPHSGACPADPWHLDERVDAA